MGSQNSKGEGWKEVKEAKTSKKFQGNGKDMKSIPNDLCKVKDLKELWISNNQITTVPKVESWPHLELFYANQNDIENLPAEIKTWIHIEEVNLSCNAKLSKIPDEVGSWTKLKQIYLNDLPLLKELPHSIGNWTSLKVLHINNTAIEELPAEVENLQNLVMVALNGNRLKELPPGIKNWKKVEKFFLNDNLMASLPNEIGEMETLQKLYVNNNKLTGLPATIGNLKLLDELYASKNEITSLPQEICSGCSSLNKLYIQENQLRELPLLSQMGELVILDVNNNVLSKLPAELESMPKLQFLHFANNQIREVPEGMVKLEQLRVFEIEEGNPLCAESLSIVSNIKSKLIPAWKFET